MKTLSATAYTLVSLAALVVLASYVAAPGVSMTVTYYPSGAVESVLSTDFFGNLHGESRYYYESGKLMSQREYERGGIKRYKNYWPSGRLCLVSTEGAGYSMHSVEYPDSD